MLEHEGRITALAQVRGETFGFFARRERPELHGPGRLGGRDAVGNRIRRFGRWLRRRFQPWSDRGRSLRFRQWLIDDRSRRLGR